MIKAELIASQEVYIFLTPDDMFLTRQDHGGYWTYGSVKLSEVDATRLFMLNKEEMQAFIKLPQKIYCPHPDDVDVHREYRKRDMKPMKVEADIMHITTE